jgi:predicted lipoprotein with Yx(FWY)xxD motif
MGVVAAMSLLAVGVASAHHSHAKLQVRKTRLGKLLVTSSGYTIYGFSLDKSNHDACQNIPGCIDAWPIVAAGGQLAGPGVRAKLIGKIKLSDGQKQLTYAGHPLYTFVGDDGPGDLANVNKLQFGGLWPAVNVAGQDVSGHKK